MERRSEGGHLMRQAHSRVNCAAAQGCCLRVALRARCGRRAGGGNDRRELIIDAQPRGGNRQTAKGFCILYSFFRFVVERFESVYQLRMRVYLRTNLGVHKDQL